MAVRLYGFDRTTWEGVVAPAARAVYQAASAKAPAKKPTDRERPTVRRGGGLELKKDFIVKKSDEITKLNIMRNHVTVFL